jgi:hydroxymethylpyrimidine pyrophosphatase-like HAD family hydrolase
MESPLPETLKAVIFDLDDTLIQNGCYGRDFNMPQLSKDILKFFREKGVRISLATMNPMGALLLNDMDYVFDTIECSSIANFYSDDPNVRNDKRPLYRKIIEKYKKDNIHRRNILVFDDYVINKIFVKSLGMKIQLVNPKKLITWNDVWQGIRCFKLNRNISI